MHVVKVNPIKTKKAEKVEKEKGWEGGREGRRDGWREGGGEGKREENNDKYILSLYVIYSELCCVGYSVKLRTRILGEVLIAWETNSQGYSQGLKKNFIVQKTEINVFLSEWYRINSHTCFLGHVLYFSVYSSVLQFSTKF